jgi:hypothetical protein
VKAAQILRFGPSVITNDDLPQPEPTAGQLLVRVRRQERAIGMRSSVRAKLDFNPCLLLLVPSYLGSSRQSERTFQDSSLATRSICRSQDIC